MIRCRSRASQIRRRGDEFVLVLRTKKTQQVAGWAWEHATPAHLQSPDRPSMAPGMAVNNPRCSLAHR